jgi:hypothetical protein
MIHAQEMAVRDEIQRKVRALRSMQFFVDDNGYSTADFKADLEEISRLVEQITNDPPTVTLLTGFDAK